MNNGYPYYTTNMTFNSKGFTLLELSIVLVVIALLVGAIFTGLYLFKSAQVRNVLGQIDRYSSAVNTFENKYDCVPGDCPNAVALGLGTSGGPGQNGDGDGKIGTCADIMFTWNWGGQQESLNFWYHLSQAGMVEGSYLGYTPIQPASWDQRAPATKLNPYAYISVFSSYPPGGSCPDQPPPSFGNFFYLSSIDSVNGYYTAALSAPDAYAIDSKIDDGLPLTGNVVTGYWWAGPRTDSGASTGCEIYPTNAYDLQGAWQLITSPYHIAADNNPARIECILMFGNAF